MKRNKYNVSPKEQRTEKKELEEMVVEGALKAVQEYRNVFERLKRDDNTKL